MTLVTLMAVKPFAEAKTRLATTLPPMARRRLAEHLFRHTLALAIGLRGARAVMVITRCEEVATIARAAGATVVDEGQRPGLNQALERGSALAMADGAQILLALSSDLPLLTADDLAEMAGDGLHAAIAPDRKESGTNAMLWSVSRPPRLRFGIDSFHLHRADLPPDARIIRLSGLALDIDDAEDLRAWMDDHMLRQCRANTPIL
jgi:2-phospho-L-lactate guanylyltransferase